MYIFPYICRAKKYAMRYLLILLLCVMCSCENKSGLGPYSKDASILGLDTKRFIYIDMSIPSGKDRLFVYDFKSRRVVYSCMVMSGSGGKGVPYRFSNRVRSHASSEGRYRVVGSPVRSNNYFLKYTLKGLDDTNSNAQRRGVVLHPSKYVPVFNTKKIGYSHGCPSVSYLSFVVLSYYIISSDKDLLLVIR